MKQWLTSENIEKHLHFKPQYEFICDQGGRLLVDYLAYFETLEQDFAEIASRLQLDSEIGRHNANPVSDYRQVYDNESRAIVARVHGAVGFARLGR